MLKKSVLALALGVLGSLVLLAVNGVIRLDSRYPTNRVSSAANLVRWEPGGAAGSTWMHAWLEYNPNIPPLGYASYTSTWGGAGWTNPVQLTAPGGAQLNDVNVAWDGFRNRFVMVGTDQVAGAIWYAYSNSAGTAWTFSNPPPFTFYDLGCGLPIWDYPSVTVDSTTGRVLVAVAYGANSRVCGPTSPYGYISTMSTDGVTWPGGYRWIGPMTGGAQSRVVATNGMFQAFIPTLNRKGVPYAIYRYQSSDGGTWTRYSLPMGTFTPPWNNTPDGSSPIIFYAPLLAAQGYLNGLWTVAFQALNPSSYNNIVICTSDRGCGWANQYAADQFLVGTSVSGDSAYWVNYFTYESGRNSLLKMQALYFPHGGSAIGSDTTKNIQVTSWFNTTGRCKSTTSGNVELCYAMGDFNTIASNPYAAATTPFVQPNLLMQDFVEDPQGVAASGNFVPNYVPISPDTDLTVTREAGQDSYAFPPAETIGAPLH